MTPSQAMPTPTDEQAAIVAAGRFSDESLMIEAYAGCAKSTTLEMLSPGIKVPALALAFNKSIAVEMGKRMPPHFSVKTMNGLGYSALMRALPRVLNFKIDEKKLGKLVTEVGKSRGVPLEEDTWAALRALVSAAMLRGLVPNDAGTPLVEESGEEWASLCDGVGIFPEDQELMVDLAREVLERDIALVREGVISFDDQLYFSVCVQGQFPKFPVLMVDEAQDLNLLQHRMLMLASRADARLIVCGDSKQSIYAFRGSDSDSLGKLGALRASWLTLPLATTFRCPKVTVARQQQHAPGFRAWHSNPEGRFSQLGVRATDSIMGEDGWSWRDVLEALPSPDVSLAILCRNNAPLVSMAFKLLRRRISVNMLGRDIGQGLVALSRKLFPRGEMGQGEMLEALAGWETTERSLAMVNQQEEKLDRVSDQAESLRAVLGFDGVRDANGLRRELGTLFGRESVGARVTLSSIHKAKGLEWDCVVHLDPWRIPSRGAREAAKRGDEAPLRQEANLRYVCETRTRHTLIEANVEDFL